MKYITTVGDNSVEMEIEKRGKILVDGQTHSVDLREIVPGRLYSLLLDGVSYEAYVEEGHGGCYDLLLKGNRYPVRVEDERTLRLARGQTGFTPDSGEIPIQAPMPGLIVSVPVSTGQPVEQGEVLVILESMKMDNELRAPRDGVVARVHIQQGDSVLGRQTLVTLG